MDRFGAKHTAAVAGRGEQPEETQMDNFRIEDIARRLFEGLPEAARTMRRDIESNFRAVLQSSLGKLDLTTREEFEVQTKVLERTRAHVGELELRIAALEKRLTELEEAIPPISD
jgi:BMFP domain-containing protein YqiC